METSTMSPIDFSRLEKLSKKINEASDELTKALTTINEKLNSLNLGIEVWLEWHGNPLKLVHGEHDWERAGRFETRWFLGYGKNDTGTWGLLARQETWFIPDKGDVGDERFIEQSVHLLLSCGRDVRIKAAEQVADLIKHIESESKRFTKTVTEAKELAEEL